MNSVAMLMTVTVAFAGLFFVCSMVFVFARKDGFRVLPLLLFASMVAIEFIPETGFSDHRSQWHHSAALVPYSFFYITLSLWLRNQQFRGHITFALITFTSGMSWLAVAVLTLSESWSFYHELLP